ncbi:autophagy-related protein 27 [Crucibulum laeve]|uniref:Autophagy-related protein 27 n=1 Tax=Crucibulum laeve TaxID=68775 RepID=A0A5C3MJ59_9AGAR|nr:autophagy-related protein 27 [Crucibulum laeve]
MILRSQTNTVLLLLLSILFLVVRADEDTPFDCHITVDDYKFDLTRLARPYVLNRTRDTPPTTTIDYLTFDLCAELKQQEGVSEQDQCPKGTRACLIKTNKRPGEDEHVIAVIPIAQTSKLQPQYSAVSSPPKHLSLQLHGAEYPNPVNSTSTPQTLNVTLFCDPEATSGPKFVSYDFARLDIEWNTPAGCPFKEEGSPPDDAPKDDDSKQEESVGSGVGWFFLVILLAFAAYFGLGAYYNYSTYGARGADLIPHRDFWKEVPYMLSDVLSHLCSTVRPRRTANRGGYISV